MPSRKWEKVTVKVRTVRWCIDNIKAGRYEEALLILESMIDLGRTVDLRKQRELAYWKYRRGGISTEYYYALLNEINNLIP